MDESGHGLAANELNIFLRTFENYSCSASLELFSFIVVNLPDFNRDFVYDFLAQ